MIRSTRAILLKELRENLPWAGLIFLAVTGVLITGFYADVDRGIPLLGRTFLTCCALVFPTVGLALGLAQIFVDYRVGRWQFVSHRPVGRSQLFLGKVIAGFLLYGLAAVVPLVGIIWWSAAPGHISGPFAWDFTEPAFAHAMDGLVWYAGGLMLAARRARWFGSRIMPISIPILGMFAGYLLAMTFTQAVLIALICLAILLTGACGAFVAGGQSSLVSGWAKPIVGFAVTMGWIMAVSIGVMSAGEGIERLRLNAVFANDATYQEYALASDGRILIGTFNWNQNPIFHDLAGNLVVGDPLENGRLVGPESVDLYLERDSSSRIRNVMDKGFLTESAHAVSLGSVQSHGTITSWTYVPSRGTLEGFDRKTRRYIGSIGPGGFIRPDEKSQPMHHEGPLHFEIYRSYLMWFADAAYRVDLENREVQTIFTTTPDDPIVAAESFPVSLNNFKLDRFYSAVATKSAIHVMRDRQQIVAVPSDPLYSENSVTVGKLDSGKLVLAYGMTRVGWWGAGEVIYDASGKEIQRIDLPEKTPLDNDHRDLPWEEVGALCFSPPAFFLTAFTLKAHFNHWVQWEPICISVAAACFYAGLGIWMLRARHAKRWQSILWTILIAGLGPAGILALPSLFAKGVGVPCSHCGKRRLVSENACCFCGTVAEGPVMHGIEVFGTGSV